MTTWHAVFWSPSKHRWLVRLGTDGTRSQRQITVPATVAPGPRSKKAAEAWAAEQLTAETAMEGKKIPTLAELAPLVLPLWAADERLAPKTRADRESMLRLHILPEFGECTVDAIDVPRVRAWVRSMRKRGDSRSAIGNRLSALSSLLSDLHAEGHASDNRAATSKAVRDELPALVKRSPVALPPAALEQLVNDADVPPWFALLSALAGLAGLEAGAALGLEVRDVQIVDGVPVALTVRQSVAMKGEAGHASIGPTKNVHRGSDERPRIVPVHPALAVLITRWLHADREMWTCSKARPHDLLVPSASGKPWRPKVAEKLRSELARIGIDVPKGLDFHGLRRCFATWLAAAGVPKDVRQRLMGHAGDVEAEHYEQASQLFESDRAAVALIPVEVQGGREDSASAHRVMEGLGGQSAAIGARKRGEPFRAQLEGACARGGRDEAVVGARVGVVAAASMSGTVEVRHGKRSEQGSGTSEEVVGASGKRRAYDACDRQAWGIGTGGGISMREGPSRDQGASQLHRSVTHAVPFAVPLPHASAQQACESTETTGAPGKNRTCDQRFRNSQLLCTAAHVAAASIVETCTCVHIASGTDADSGPVFVAAVPDAVRGMRDDLRWVVMPFDAADAMLAALEAT